MNSQIEIGKCWNRAAEKMNELSSKKRRDGTLLTLELLVMLSEVYRAI